MQIIVEVVEDGVVTPEIIRRRLLAEPRDDVQLAGFQVAVVGEVLPKFDGLVPYMTGAKPAEPLPYGGAPGITANVNVPGGGGGGVSGLQMGKMDAAADRAAIDTLAGEESC